MCWVAKSTDCMVTVPGVPLAPEDINNSVIISDYMMQPKKADNKLITPIDPTLIFNWKII